jgi:prevent-host-death family protein
MEVNIHQAKTHLSKLLRRTMEGEEVIIARAGVPIARLVSIERERAPFPLGLDRGTEEFYLSAASSWEISVKSALGRLRLSESAIGYVPKRMAAQGVRRLSITHSYALAVSELPPYHNGPFGHLLIAQAQVEGMAILTADRAFRLYPVEIVWCGG